MGGFIGEPSLFPGLGLLRGQQATMPPRNEEATPNALRLSQSQPMWVTRVVSMSTVASQMQPSIHNMSPTPVAPSKVSLEMLQVAPAGKRVIKLDGNL